MTPIMSMPTMLFSLSRRIRLIIYFILSYPIDERVRFFRFGIPLVLKYASRLYSTEADALRVLNESKLPLPIPRLVDAIRYRSETYTLMTRLSGNTLLSEFRQGSLSDHDIDKIVQDLKMVLYTLWKLKQSPADSGKVMLSGSGDGLPDSMNQFHSHDGPNDSILDCYVGLTTHLNESDQYAWDASNLLSVYPDATNAVISDDVSWVHMDLRPHNILVRNGRLSAVIDWEDSGWLPRHWQLIALCRPTIGNHSHIRQRWIDTQFSPQTEAAYKACYDLLYYPVI
ncbi:kinase-like protein [Cyathus striatus]|nr:kinase-like protein [Cyathus striatus]